MDRLIHNLSLSPPPQFLFGYCDAIVGDREEWGVYVEDGGAGHMGQHGVDAIEQESDVADRLRHVLRIDDQNNGR